MTRKLKALGVAVVAVMALSAVVASAAMALTPKLEVGTGDGNLTGTQTEVNVLTVAGGRTLTCEVATFTGVLATTSATVTLTPVYEKCHSVLAGVKVPATITTNGCDFLLHVGATNGTDSYAATVDLLCPTTLMAGKKSRTMSKYMSTRKARYRANTPRKPRSAVTQSRNRQAWLLSL